MATTLPYVGSTPAYFAGMAAFCTRHHCTLGDAFVTTLLGKAAYFVTGAADVTAVLRASEKYVSMYQAFGTLGGPLLPRESDTDYATVTAAQRKQISQGHAWDGVPATPLIAHAVRPPKLAAWIPSIRQVLDKTLAKLNGGQVDLFAWCQEFIQSVTARLLLGDSVPLAVQEQWVALVQQCEPEEAISGQASWQTAAEVALGRERAIFAQCRAILEPYLDKELVKVQQQQQADCNNKNDDTDGSVMASYVRQWHERLKGNDKLLQVAKRRIANDMFFFSFAAIINSFVMAAWVLYHVMRNTEDCGTRIKQELETLGDEAGTWPELENTILEIGRLYSPDVTFRKVIQPFVLPSCQETIPPGSLVMISKVVCHRNPKYFSNPYQFDPSRLDRDEHKQAGALFQPFGAGVHPCSGRKLAVLEIAMLVRAAMQTFDWKLVKDNNEMDDDPFTQSMISNVPGHPALNPAQTTAIWKPLHPVMVEYKRKKVV